MVRAFVMQEVMNPPKRAKKKSQVKKRFVTIAPRANPSQATITRGQVGSGPQFRSLPGGGLCIKHSEYNQTLSSNITNTTLIGFGINPMNSTDLPWLSGVASSFGMYRWKKLVVSYASVAPTTLSGQVALGIFYDIDDLAAWALLTSTAFPALMSCAENSVGPFYGSQLYEDVDGMGRSEISVECDVQQAHLRTPWSLLRNWVTTDPTALDNQAVTCYLGTLTGSNGVATQPCGTLHISYEIELIHPVSNLVTGTTFQPQNKWLGTSRYVNRFPTVVEEPPINLPPTMSPPLGD